MNVSSLLFTRREMLRRAGAGFGFSALGTLLAESGFAATPSSLDSRWRTRPAKAKSVIFLHMAGAPSQLELFDYKPELVKYDGKPCPDELLKGKRFAFIKGVPRMLGTPYKFKQHGQSGAWLSELLPNLSTVVDDLTIIRSMSTDQFNHAPAQLFLHTGNPRFGFASMGAWATYGLGSENEDLPGFVVLTSGGNNPDGGKSLWGSAFLPSVHQGVQGQVEAVGQCLGQ